MNRREFVACGGGAALVLGAGAWAALRPRTATGSGWASGARPLAAIFDSRFPDSLRFGQSAARIGLESWPIRGDVTELLLNRLRPLWAQGEGALVGMTSAASLLCIQQFAADFWMRVVARVDHLPQDGMPGAAPWAANLLGPLVQALDRPAQSRTVQAAVMTAPLVSWAIATRKEVPT